MNKRINEVNKWINLPQPSIPIITNEIIDIEPIV